MSKKKSKPTPSARHGKRPAGEAPYYPKRDLQRLALQVFEQGDGRVLTYKQVCHAFGKTTMAQKRVIYQALVDLTTQGVLQELEPGRFVLQRQEVQSLTGVFDYRAGRATFLPDEEKLEPMSLADRALGQALHGDRVAVSFVRNRRGEYKRLQVVEVLERKPSTYVGRLQISRGYAFFVAPHRELRQDVFIPADKTKGATPQDKVLVRILDWDKKSKNPRGEVLDILGRAGENSTEMHAILAEYGLPYSYPEEVERVALSLAGDITPEELSRREDFRGVLTCTIDPADAKDFDDALSFRVLPSGDYEVGVHIADVSHFVVEGGLIDEEAYRRATSVYLVDRTIPMLPERLSNYLCSLRPDEDKYAYSCVFTLSEQAEVRQARIARTVIRSQRRFTYEEAQQIIETGRGDHAEAILTLHGLAQQLRRRRFAQGSVAFERPEVRFELDEAGKPLSILIKESKAAHQLIEEFMLLANRTVAERIKSPERQDITPAVGRSTRGTLPFVYRIHEAPDTEKLQSLAEFVRRFGYKLRSEGSEEAIAMSLNKLLSDIKGKPEEDMLTMLAIRSMAKARYTTATLGHYGLGFVSYTHFTSPIRRYPDLMVHRLLTRYLFQGQGSADATVLEEQCEHASERETLAANAERASIKYKQVEYMLPRLGERFTGVITGLADWGIYVELEETKCEGLVPARDLTDDYYTYDERNFRLVGRHRGRVFSLGDRLEVLVAQADLQRKQLDFTLAED